MALLMALVLLCTLAQVELGTLAAVNTYMRAWIVFYKTKAGFSIPVFPGGTLVGLVFALNLMALTAKRLGFAWNKAGLWFVHVGLILLVLGEFVSGALQVDARMAIEEGQTVNYVEHAREVELAVVEGSDPRYDDIYGIPEKALARGGSYALPGTPVTIKVKKFYTNAVLARRNPADPPGEVNMGVGAGVKVTEAEPVSNDNDLNRGTAIVEALAGGKSYGTWLVSLELGAPQSFTHEGKTYALGIRPRRTYLPYSLHLKKFSHDLYPGTQIPKNFSSLVTLENPGTQERRDVLIYMNQPLRYDGKAFYQASFGKEDTLSILQVVSNPGWLLPYISCVLVTIGLLIHFGITLRRSMKRRQEALAPKEA
ncbi:MAG: cytochrome c biogenesis protein ResB [Acidobacteria bacterium]|nr:cytochrome c biogenesis protein ResB [Acidobacteriota bacterium]